MRQLILQTSLHLPGYRRTFGLDQTLGIIALRTISSVSQIVTRRCLPYKNRYMSDSRTTHQRVGQCLGLTGRLLHAGTLGQPHVYREILFIEQRHELLGNHPESHTTQQKQSQHTRQHSITTTDGPP